MPAHSPHSTSEVKRFLDALPVQNPQSRKVIDAISKDHSEEDTPAVRIFFTALTWLTVAFVVSAITYLTWVMFTDI